MRLVGSGFWVRGYFVLFGIGVCWLVYLIAKEYLDERLGRISLLLSVFSPLMIFTSQYARSYIDSAFWMLLSVLFMLKIIKGTSVIEALKIEKFDTSEIEDEIRSIIKEKPGLSLGAYMGILRQKFPRLPGKDAMGLLKKLLPL